MSVFHSPDFDDHEHVSFFTDEASGLRAIVAIHSTAPFGISGGGCRFWPYSSDEAALQDALRLSRAMSYKLALADKPAGGAKSVVIGDSAKDKTEALLKALGRAVERLAGRYIIAEDVGTTPEDMRVIATQTRYVMGRTTDTGPATAYGAFVALRTAAARAFGSGDLTGRRVAVQGLGNVGHRLCKHLAHAGARLVVTDVDERAVRAVVSELSSRTEVLAVRPEAIVDQEVDVFAPCALGSILSADTIPRLHCKVIAGAANNQLSDERLAPVLAERGILYAPDFIVNMGGVIGASQGDQAVDGAGTGIDYDEAQAFRETEVIGSLLTSVLDLADRERISTHAAAVRVAKDKIRARAGGQ